ncbi:MAG: ACT domain-containing protein [Bacteroidota bacterium]
MTGETDLTLLLRNMRPERNPGEYVFCRVESLEQAAALQPVGLFREKEGVTVIVPRTQADREALPYSLVCAWITLTVHSSLEAVGLTAAVSKALTERNISCNVVAGYTHDHIFVPLGEAERAMEAFDTLTAIG